MTDLASPSVQTTPEKASEFSPAAISQRRFGSAFRGYDSDEVRTYLQRVSSHVKGLSEQVGGLSIELAAARSARLIVDLTEGSVPTQIGAGEVDPGGVPDVPTLSDVKAEAVAQAASMVDAARLEAKGILDRANEEAGRILLRARAESRGKQADGTRVSIDTAGAGELVADSSTLAGPRGVAALSSGTAEAVFDVPNDPEAARAQARAMIQEARAVRERILTDLAKRRRTAHVQLEQLRVAREKLQETLREARRVIDASSKDVSHAEVEARLAAEAAGRRVSAEPMPTVEELEIEVMGGRLLSVFRPSDLPEADRSDVLVDVAPVAVSGEIGVSGSGDTAQDLATQDLAIQDLATQDLATQDLDDPTVPLRIEASAEDQAEDQVEDQVENQAEDEHTLPVVVPVAVLESPELEPVEVEQALVTEVVDLEVEAVEVQVDAVEVQVDVVELVQPVMIDLLTDDVSPINERPTLILAPLSMRSNSPSSTPVSTVPTPAVVSPVVSVVPAVGSAVVPAAAVGQEVPVKRRRVDDVFARIRAEREASNQHAREVLRSHPMSSSGTSALATKRGVHPEISAESHAEFSVDDVGEVVVLETLVPETLVPCEAEAVAEPADRRSPEVLSADEVVSADDRDSAIIERRNHEMELLQLRVSKQLKRHLQDEHSSALTAVRRGRGRLTVDAILGAADEQNQGVIEVMTPALTEAALAGGRVAESFGHFRPTSEATAEPLVSNMALDLLGPIRRALGSALEHQHADVPAVLGQSFREWNTDRLSRMVRDVLSASFAGGLVGSLAPGTEVHWLVDHGDEPSPDCDDNALAGTILMGDSFPTGHSVPPLGPGCRCLVVPRNNA